MTTDRAHRGRILIVKLGAIGDVVMTLPAALLLHEAGYAVDWMCSAAIVPILERYDWIHPIVVNEKALREGGMATRVANLFRIWKRLFGARYELCACLYYDVRYKVLTLPVRARKSVSLSHTDRDRMLVPGRHHTDEYARVMLSRLDRRADGECPSVLPPVPFPGVPQQMQASDRKNLRVLLCPGGARNALRDDPLRRWPLENYVALAARLAEAGADVELIGGPEDAWVSSAFEAVPVSDHIGELSLVETLSLMAGSDALVTHDTGPLHLAGLTQIAIVGLFGPTDPRTRLPRRAGVTGLWGGESFACRPCYDGRDFANCQNNGCLQEVSTSAVLEALSRLVPLPKPLQSTLMAPIRMVPSP